MQSTAERQNVSCTDFSGTAWSFNSPIKNKMPVYNVVVSVAEKSDIK